MKLKNFNFDGNGVTTLIDKNDNFWFVANDVCKILKHSNSRQMVRDNCKSEGVSSTYILTTGGKQKKTIINESNLYRLIFRSKMEKAKDFQDWVVEEVLPQIRKTGKYFISKTEREQSIKNRNMITDAWKKSGVNKKEHYINLTKEEYKALKFKKGSKKEKMTRHELLKLSAFESMEAFNLYLNEKDGYYECKKSINETAYRLPTFKKLDK